MTAPISIKERGLTKSQRLGRWSADDDQHLAYWYSEVGVDLAIIAAHLGRRHDSVLRRVQRLKLTAPPLLTPAGRRALSESGPG